MAGEKKEVPNLFEVSSEEFAEYFDKFFALQEARAKHPYVADIIKVLLPYDRGLSRSFVLHELEKQRRKDGLPIPDKFEQAVQSSYNQFSVDSVVYLKRGAPPDEGIFYSPEGKGSGRWAVDKGRAIQWLRNKLGD